jgi:hypothetical protein
VCRALASSHVANLVDAASVMLDKFHQPPVSGQLDDRGESSRVELDWVPPSLALQHTHANELDATEDGAYAVALSTVVSRGFVVQRRAHHGSGADYLITPVGEPNNDFYKLEVSGIARTTGNIQGRLRTKARQVSAGDLSRPGLAIVVGFEAAQIMVEQRP